MYVCYQLSRWAMWRKEHQPWVSEVLSLLNVLIEALPRPSLCRQPLNDPLLLLRSTRLLGGRGKTGRVRVARPSPLPLS